MRLLRDASVSCSSDLPRCVGCQARPAGYPCPCLCTCSAPEGWQWSTHPAPGNSFSGMLPPCQVILLMPSMEGRFVCCSQMLTGICSPGSATGQWSNTWSVAPSVPGVKEHGSVRLDAGLPRKLAYGRQTWTTLDSFVPSETSCRHHVSQQKAVAHGGLSPSTPLHLTLITCPLLLPGHRMAVTSSGKPGQDGQVCPLVCFRDEPPPSTEDGAYYKGRRWLQLLGTKLLRDSDGLF